MPTGSSHRRWLGLGLKTAVSLALLGVILTGLDRRALDLAAGLPPAVLAASFGLLLLGQVLAGLRLFVLLRVQSARVGFGAALRLTFVGSFLSNFTPGTVGGDVGKGWLLVRGRVEPRVTVLALVVERLAAFVTTVALTAAMVGWSGLWRQAPEPLRRGLPAILAAAAILLLVASLWRGRLRRLARAAAATLRRRLPAVSGSGEILRRWLASPAAWGAGVGLSALAFLSSVAGQWLLLRPLGIDIAPVTFTALVGIVYVVSLVPISLNGLGVREVSLLLLLTGAGAGQQPAAVFALVTRLLGLARTLPGALGLLGSRLR